MLTFILISAFLLMIAWFTVDGYKKGVYYGIVRFSTLVTIYMLAGPIGKMGSGMFQNFEMIPAVARPYLATLIVSMLLLTLGSAAANFVRWQTMKLPEEPTERQLENVQKARVWGMVLGGIVGIAMSSLLFIILWNIGWVAEEMRKDPSREMETLVEEGDSRGGLGELVAEKMITVKNGIDQSPFGEMVKATNPVEVDDYELVRDVLSLTRDPILMQEFQQHPNVREIIAYPPVADALYDDGVRTLVQTRDFRGMLKNEKIALLVRDTKLQKMVRDANLREVLREIKEKTGRE